MVAHVKASRLVLTVGDCWRMICSLKLNVVRGKDMSHVESQLAIDKTLGSDLYAIFHRDGAARVAIKRASAFSYKTYREKDGFWIESDGNLSTWCCWNAELQGLDDISTLIK